MTRVKRIAALVIIAAAVAVTSVAVSQPPAAGGLRVWLQLQSATHIKHCGESRVWIRVETILPWEDHCTVAPTLGNA